MRKIVLICLMLALALGVGTPAQADPYITLGTAANFAILGLYNTTNSFGQMTVNSATVVTGDFGYADKITSTTNQKIGEGYFGEWTGTAYVHSGANFSYDDKNYIPTGGVQIGGASNAKLNQASADAYAAASAIAALSATQTYTGNINDISVSFNSTTAVNVIDITGYVNMNSDTFTLNGRAGYTDWFIIRVGDAASDSFDFSQSTVVLNNTDAAHVLWFFGYDQHVLINKSASVFKGTILAPYEQNNDVTYHNPASFEGAIISNNIYVHSDFNLTHNGFVPTPLPGAVLLLGAGMARLVAYARRRQNS